MKEIKNTKNIPKEWYPDIIKLTTQSIKTPILRQKFNLKERSFDFEFKDDSQREDFYKDFTIKLIPSINNFIVAKGESPETYNRNVVFGIKDSTNILTIAY